MPIYKRYLIVNNKPRGQSLNIAKTTITSDKDSGLSLPWQSMDYLSVFEPSMYRPTQLYRPT